MTDVTWVSSLTTLGVGPLLGAAVGFVGSGVVQRGSDKRAAQREREARTEARQQRLEDERRAFQVETFDKLPALVQQYARVVVKTLLFDLKTLKELGTLTSSIPDDEDELAHRFELRVVAAQVLDDGVRRNLGQLQDELWLIQNPPESWRTSSAEEMVAERTLQLDRVQQLVTESSEVLNKYRRSLYSGA
jgi:vacuolar-type H+-ATPase subunit I/STV1